MSNALELEPVTSTIDARAAGRDQLSIRTTPAGRRMYRRGEFEVVGLLVAILVVLVILALTLGVTPPT
jgi:hypothetical protein